MSRSIRLLASLSVAVASALTAGCGDSGATNPVGAGGAGGTGGAEPCQIDLEQVRFEPGPICQAFCEVGFVECRVLSAPEDNDECMQVCERDRECTARVSEACGAANDAMFECATNLGCDDFRDWVICVFSSNPPPVCPCGTFVDAAREACV